MNQFVKEHKAPRIPKKILRWYCKPDLLEDIEGDIEEDFNKRYTRQGKHIARLYYLLNVIRFFRPFAVKNILKIQINSMFKLNTRIAFRNLIKNKLYSSINITGLSVGITACFIIAHYVNYQLSFDRQFEHSDQLYRMHVSYYQNGAYRSIGRGHAYGLGPALKKDIPEFENLSLVHHYRQGAVINTVNGTGAKNPVKEKGMLFVEPAFLDMFSIDFLAGSSQSALTDDMSIILTKTMALKYFNDVDKALGKSLNLAGQWGVTGDYIITGVIKDFPKNSHLNLDFLLPLSNVLKTEQYQWEGSDWNWTNFYLYAQLTKHSTEENTEEKIANLMHTYEGDRLKEEAEEKVLSLQPITELQLKSEVNTGSEGNINTVYFMMGIAAIILLIAWINFINLSTARASERMVEVGVKKTMGASRRQLVAQFLTESFWINFLSLSAALLLSYWLLPKLGTLVDVNLSFDLSAPYIKVLLVALLFGGPLLSGIYPAFFMSAFEASKSLKGDTKITSKGRIPLRRVLVVTQFVVSLLMIAGTYALSEQLKFMRSQPTGFNMEKLLVVKGPLANAELDKVERFRNDIKSMAAVDMFCTSTRIPGSGYNWNTEIQKEGADKSTQKGVSIIWVDHDFFATYQIEMLAGRDFSDAIQDLEDENQVIIQNGAILNETMVKSLGLGTPTESIGQPLHLSGQTIKVRGVMKDHNWNSLHRPITSGIFLYLPSNTDYFTLTVNRINLDATLASIQDQFNKSFPGNPMEYYFLDDFFDRQYQADRQAGKVFSAFALLAIITACLGLFGLMAFTLLQKTKEIGIRKVLGAGLSDIANVVSKDYLNMILLANVLAIPLAYWGIELWLRNFAFKTPITFRFFLIPAVMLFGIALVTMAFHINSVLKANPVQNLRSE